MRGLNCLSNTRLRAERGHAAGAGVLRSYVEPLGDPLRLEANRPCRAGGGSCLERSYAQLQRSFIEVHAPAVPTAIA